MRIALLGLILICTPALAEVRVVDFIGREVALEKPAQRIIALAPHTVENVFSAGAGEKIVGVVSYSNFPAEARAITRVGGYKSFSLETILSLNPDLIIMWLSGNGLSRLQDLAILGIPIYVSEPRQLSDISRSIRDYEVLTGRAKNTVSVADRIDSAIADLSRRYASKEKVGVFYQVWNEPLQTLSGEHLISKVIELCGGYNVFAEATSLAPKISLEAVLETDPDTIIASGMAAARPDWLDEWKAYPFLRAVKSDALFFLDPNHIQRPTARVLLGAERLCQQLDSRR